MVEGLPSMRRTALLNIVKQAIVRSHKPDFRITHYNVESNHLHFIIEAASNRARALAIAGLKISIAKRVNKLLGRSGSVFEDRYDARPLRTPREVRNAIRYVLTNAIHHGVAPTDRAKTWIDPCSSAAWFDGWREPVQPDTWWKRRLLEEPPPVARPTVWLLTVGWRRHGLIAFDEVKHQRDLDIEYDLEHAY